MIQKRVIDLATIIHAGCQLDVTPLGPRENLVEMWVKTDEDRQYILLKRYYAPSEAVFLQQLLRDLRELAQQYIAEGTRVREAMREFDLHSPRCDACDGEGCDACCGTGIAGMIAP